MRFIDRFDRNFQRQPQPRIINPDVCVSFYLFDKWHGKPEADPRFFESYVHETYLAYRQLMQHTNIMKCGQVIIFVDSRCVDRVQEILSPSGLDTLICPISVGTDGIRLSGYIPYFDFDDTCRYHFHLDTDLWWIAPRTRRIFDWETLCHHLDLIPGNCLFGRGIQKRGVDWLHYFGQHLDTLREIEETASAVLDLIFEDDLPDNFSKVLEGCDEVLSIDSAAGWLVGVRQNSQAAETLQSCWNTYGSEIVSDEGFYAILLEKYPEIWVHDIFYDPQFNVNPYPIYELAIDNVFETYEVGPLNVGAREISEGDEAVVEKLKGLFQ